MSGKKFLVCLIAAQLFVALISANAQDESESSNTVAEQLLTTQGGALVPRLSTEMLISGDSPVAKKMRDLLSNYGADPNALAGKRIALTTTDGVEEVEVTIPLVYLKARGAQVDIVAPRKPEIPDGIPVQIPSIRETHILTVRYMENGTWIKIDRYMDEVQASEYDAVIVPGGAWNPDNLRLDQDALNFLNAMHESGKLVTAICHGPQVLINAGLISGKKVTSYWNVHIDLKNAGGTVLDQPVVVDGNLITSRFPTDLSEFLAAIEQALTQGS